MVLGVTLAGGAAVGSWLWGYNRENFMFDREMRQRNELQILNFRNVQASLWREDIRDIISLTEKKMDSYLIVSVLQLDACLGLFTEGRLEPGTPPWLLHFYMMTLGAAFMYLLMSVWFAMHASVVAQCSSVRILTQFVRLPVPTWEELENMRTYASAYESVHPAHWLRVPFTKSLAPKGGFFRHGVGTPQAAPTGAAGVEVGSATATTPFCTTPFGATPRPATAGNEEKGTSRAPMHTDPWGLESHGAYRDLYELQEHPITLRRHVALARKAATQYQCFDAFARVAMTFGTNQFLSAIAYYALGYVAVQDGASWPAWCVVILMAAIAMAMSYVDFSLTRCEQWVLQALIFIAFAAASASTMLFTHFGARSETVLPYMLPVTYLAHALWLYRALRCCGIVEQTTGTWLPTKFRAVLYLDVFGWLHKEEEEEDFEPSSRLPSKGQRSVRLSTIVEKHEIDAPTWSPNDFSPGSPNHGSLTAASGPSGQIHHPPDNVFHPTSYAPSGTGDPQAHEDVVTGHERIQPGKLAASVFRAGTVLLILMWLTGSGLPFTYMRTAKPVVADIFKLEAGPEGPTGESAMHAVVSLDPSGLPELTPVVEDPEALPLLVETAPERIQVAWPSHASFIPRALASDALGEQLIVADDFSIYTGWLTEGVPGEVGQPQPSAETQPIADARMRGTIGRRKRRLADTSATHAFVAFEEGRPCNALEGQSFRDIAVLCDPAVLSMCRLIVLSNHGGRLTECPLPQRMDTVDGQDFVARPMSGSQRSRNVAQPSHNWTVAQDWLRAPLQESIQSVAVNAECVTPWLQAKNVTGHVFTPQETGCAIVGTSIGRIVQLREAAARPNVLIPERIMHQRAHPSSRGSLTILRGRILLTLWSKYSSISAFDSQTGALIKEWRLPSDVQWLMMASGGRSLFVVGVSGESGVDLYRFPIPSELLRAAHQAEEKAKVEI